MSDLLSADQGGSEQRGGLNDSAGIENGFSSLTVNTDPTAIVLCGIANISSAIETKWHHHTQADFFCVL
jgi:hypothetical protein